MIPPCSPFPGGVFGSSGTVAEEISRRGTGRRAISDSACAPPPAVPAPTPQSDARQLSGRPRKRMMVTTTNEGAENAISIPVAGEASIDHHRITDPVHVVDGGQQHYQQQYFQPCLESPQCVYEYPFTRLTRQDSTWSIDGSSSMGPMPFNVGDLMLHRNDGMSAGFGMDKCPEIEISDLSYYEAAARGMVMSPVPLSNASTIMDSPPSTIVSRTSSVSSSAWSPVQTEFASVSSSCNNKSASGTIVAPSNGCASAVAAPHSRGPSPLRNVVAQPPSEDDGGGHPLHGANGTYSCPAPRCGSIFSRRQDRDIHVRTGHTHVCLWGDDGPCDSGGFATREELNWHVKSEHLHECPVRGCTTTGGFGNRDLVDCHIRWVHGGSISSKISAIDNLAGDAYGIRRSSNLLEPAPPDHSTPQQSTERQHDYQTGPEEQNTPKPLPVERDRALKMAMSIGISKKRCREQLRAVVEKRAKRTNGGTPASVGSPGLVRCRTPKILETASFPIAWEHGVLPFLIEFLPKWCGPGHAISVTRGRKPGTRRICIMTRKLVTTARRIVIAGHVRDLLPDAYRSTITFVFSTGEVDRLVWARGLSKEMHDEICVPRNPFAYISPCMGDSVGTTLEGGEEVTATLGPVVTVGGGNYWLASFHPFINAGLETSTVTLEHPSPEDRTRCSNERHDALSNEGLHFRVGDLTATSGYDLNTTRISHEFYWEDCDMEAPLVVTDWVLISTNTHQANLLRKFPSTTQRREIPVTSMRSIGPGSNVFSTGRSSGFQRGQICEIPAYVDGSKSGNGTGKATREWFIEEPYPQDNEDDWIRGGIGVEGDSGAPIIDSETNALIGQLWGRNKYFGAGPRITYFTPIFDIFDDIQERCGQQTRPRLPQYRDEAERWPVYPVCRQCYDLREYLESRRSSRESMMSMIGHNDARAGENDNDLTSVSELATPKDHTRDQSYLIRHVGPDEPSTSFGSVVSPAPIHTFYPSSQAASPGTVVDLRSPYAQTLNDEDLYETGCSGATGAGLGKRPAVPVQAFRTGETQTGKRRRVE